MWKKITIQPPPAPMKTTPTSGQPIEDILETLTTDAGEETPGQQRDATVLTSGGMPTPIGGIDLGAGGDDEPSFTMYVIALCYNN